MLPRPGVSRTHIRRLRSPNRARLLFHHRGDQGSARGEDPGPRPKSGNSDYRASIPLLRGPPPPPHTRRGGTRLVAKCTTAEGSCEPSIAWAFVPGSRSSPNRFLRVRRWLMVNLNPASSGPVQPQPTNGARSPPHAPSSPHLGSLGPGLDAVISGGASPPLGRIRFLGGAHVSTSPFWAGCST